MLDETELNILTWNGIDIGSRPDPINCDVDRCDIGDVNSNEIIKYTNKKINL